MSKSSRADAILQALLTTRTIREAAASLKLSERTIYNHLEDPAFKARYQLAQSDLHRGAVNHLRELQHSAIDTLASVMKTGSRDRDRLAAAKLILEFNARYAEIQDIQERLQLLEAALADL